ncbi:uncharacterized protein LOC143416169 isoform X1 [Maylandia zebra]|uniref:uncharacterized protein LOC143416169 isoform X1 n=1 Tax=Maylandia zebra TaxID=106582 RepID=UPI00403C2334
MARRGLDSPLDFAAGRLDYVVERPAEEGLPEVIRILDDSDTERVSEGEYGEYIPLPSSPSSPEAQDPDDSEEEGEYPPYIPEDVEEVSEDTDNSSDWNNSEEWADWPSDDSGYDTMDERADSPLIQELPPEPFWHDWQHPIAPGAAPFAMPPFGQANAPLFPVGDPLASPASSAPPSAASSPAPLAASSPAPSAPSSPAPSSATLSASPSTSALTSSAKRSGDDTCTDEVSAKRCKVSDDTFYGPSTSSGSVGVRRFWERPFNLSLDDSDSD